MLNYLHLGNCRCSQLMWLSFQSASSQRVGLPSHIVELHTWFHFVLHWPGVKCYHCFTLVEFLILHSQHHYYYYFKSLVYISYREAEWSTCTHQNNVNFISPCQICSLLGVLGKLAICPLFFKWLLSPNILEWTKDCTSCWLNWYSWRIYMSGSSWPQLHL